MPPTGHGPDKKAAGETAQIEALESVLRHALHHMYDPSALLKSPLVNCLVTQGEKDPIRALRGLVMRLIEEFRPGNDEPSGTHAWRLYDLLHFRFVEQLTQQEVAFDLGLSIRQLRRDEKAAVHLLARRIRSLWPEALDLASAMADPDSDSVGAEAALSLPQSSQDELIWLRQTQASEQVALDQVLDMALKTILPLAEQRNVQVDLAASDVVEPVSAGRLALRQLVISLLMAAIEMAPGGMVRVEQLGGAYEVTLRIKASGPRGRSAREDPTLDEALQMVGQLAQASGTRLRVLETPAEKQRFAAEVLLPYAQRLPVLVVDDNTDALRLLEHCMAGSRYRFVGISDPERALEAALDSECQAIILDVMLPRVDGWELLGRLSQHPVLQSVPIIVCSILPQEQLGLALGADVFLRKPVSRSALLRALDSVVPAPSAT